jgi:16S rRNA (cytidine1402-2'-O)-methyltransferase
MPSTSPIHKSGGSPDPPGSLYVVATPIGNREDITLRALRVLGEVDLIAAEDTRHTRRFLQYHRISGRLLSYHEHNEARRTPELIQRLKDGVSVALVSNAGTPAVSDPGFRLVRAVLEAGLPVVPVPGACAAVCALSVSGLPTDTFVFIGFLPRKKGDRQRQLEALSGLKKTLIFYESPRRILAIIKEIQGVMGDRFAVIGREMTKRYEEVLRGSLSMVGRLLEKRGEIKGECTLLVAGKTDAPVFLTDDLREELREAVLDGRRSLSEIAKKLAESRGLSRRVVYEEALRIKDGVRK